MELKPHGARGRFRVSDHGVGIAEFLGEKVMELAPSGDCATLNSYHPIRFSAEFK
jgi:hypothetical protein